MESQAVVYHRFFTCAYLIYLSAVASIDVVRRCNCVVSRTDTAGVILTHRFLGAPFCEPFGFHLCTSTAVPPFVLRSCLAPWLSISPH